MKNQRRRPSSTPKEEAAIRESCGGEQHGGGSGRPPVHYRCQQPRLCVAPEEHRHRPRGRA